MSLLLEGTNMKRGVAQLVVVVVCYVGCLVKNKLADHQIGWSLANLPHNRLVDQKLWVQLTLLHIGLHLQSNLRQPKPSTRRWVMQKKVG